MHCWVIFVSMGKWVKIADAPFKKYGYTFQEEHCLCFTMTYFGQKCTLEHPRYALHGNMGTTVFQENRLQFIDLHIEALVISFQKWWGSSVHSLKTTVLQHKPQFQPVWGQSICVMWVDSNTNIGFPCCFQEAFQLCSGLLCLEPWHNGPLLGWQQY